MGGIKNDLINYVLRIADNNLILGHRIAEWCGHGPVLEQDIALTNIALDLIGQANLYLDFAAELKGDDWTADKLAFSRDCREFKNILLVEQPNGDFAHTIVRQLIYDVFHYHFIDQLNASHEERLAAIAQRSLKEISYHKKFSTNWTLRLGDGTDESHKRMQTAVNELWAFSEEMLVADELDIRISELGVGVSLEAIKPMVMNEIRGILTEATLEIPERSWFQKGGKSGFHTEHLGHILSELQFMQRAYPDLNW